MYNILKKFNINEKFTRPLKKQTVFTKIKDNIPHKQDLNFMMDILILPKTKEDYNMLLVCVDLHSREFDIQPIKNKDADTVLKAFKEMLKRSYLNLPKYSIQTDNDGAFKGVFQKYLYDNSILHKTAQPYRHQQNSMVESLNKQLARLLNGYMNSKEEETGKPYNEWIDILPDIRKELNKYRKIPDGNIKNDTYQPPNDDKPSMFKEGDIVYVKSEVPLNALGHPQTTSNFRVGDYRFDRTPKKIMKVIYMSGAVPHRYIVEGKPHVSYVDSELMKSDEKETKYIVEKFLKKRFFKKQVQYLVKWKNYKISESTFQNEKQLIEDLGKQHFDDLVKQMEK